MICYLKITKFHSEMIRKLPRYPQKKPKLNRLSQLKALECVQLALNSHQERCSLIMNHSQIQKKSKKISSFTRNIQANHIQVSIWVKPIENLSKGKFSLIKNIVINMKTRCSNYKNSIQYQNRSSQHKVKEKQSLHKLPLKTIQSL